MEENRMRRILLLYKSMIPSVRLCGHCQLERLAEQGVIEYRHKRAMQITAADVAWADTVLLCRLDDAYELWLARKLKQAGKRIVYVMDDDLLNVPSELTSGRYYGRKTVQESIRGILALSDALISPSPVLLKKYAVNGIRGILLEEPAIDPVAWEPRDASRPVRIGFAGSVDRTGDIEQILRESLMRLREEYGTQVEFVFFGAVPSFAGELGATCIPYCDSYDAYRETLNTLRLDIGLAPMPDTPFHACKHYNKFVEYAAAGIVGVFSDVKPYDRLKENFGWELLCANTTEQWYGAVKQLLDDPAKLESLRRRVTEMASDVFSVEVIAKALAGELERIPAGKCGAGLTGPAVMLRLRKGEARVRRGWDVLRRYGVRFPLVLLRKLGVRLK